MPVAPRRLLSPNVPRLAAAAIVAALLLAATGPALIARLAESRIQAAARARGLVAHWRRASGSWPARVTFRDLVVRRAAEGDTVLRADSLDVALDPWALLVLHRRVAAVALSHAAIRLPAHRAAETDTLAPEAAPPPVRSRRAEPPDRSQAVRRSAETLARLLVLPARALPRLDLRDVTLSTPPGADLLWSGARLAWLELRPGPTGVALAAAGAIAGEREIPFETSLLYAPSDRITGGARIGIPDSYGSVSPLRVSVDGTLAQNRRTGSFALADTTRVTVGNLPLRLGVRLQRRGPAFRFRLAADGLTEGRVKASLPPAILGPLLDVSVRGSWDYRLGLDLDLSRPDSVSFTANVIPHGLSLDPAGTRLRLLGLDQPFVASIHLPRDRVVSRDLSAANPFFRPLDAIAPTLVYAVVTNEDGGFFHHRGFNLEAMRGAIVENLRAGAFRRGAGTITMQLARNLYLGHERTLSRKFREVVLAWTLEHLSGVSKQRLLEIYFNIIEWGPDVHGAGEAARYYFDRDPARLSVDEALFLATVVPAPTKWRYRFDAAGELRPFERAQMHFIGRAMIAKGWLAPEDLPAAETLRVELRGTAREALEGAVPGAGEASAARPWADSRE